MSSLSGGFSGRVSGAGKVGRLGASVFAAAKPSAFVAALLFAVPFLFYFSVSGRWSLDGDEFYTYFDSAQPISELLAYEIKPLYYLICHALLDADLGLPLESLLRAPATLAASLIAPVFYWMLFPVAGRRAALLGAFLLIANPWIFEFSQYARFYSLMLLFSVVATLAIYRWVEDPRVRWLAIFFGAAGLATATHTTAGVLFPAASAGVIAVLIQRDPKRALRMARRFGARACFLGCALAIAAWLLTRDQFALWLHTEAGGYGSYSVAQILAALLVHVGLPVWALAIIPLLKRGRDWTPGEVFLLTTLSLSVIPFLALAAFDGGGGVAARYTLAATPGVFILAARHWAAIDKKIGARGLRVGLVGAVLAFNVPYLLSIHGDGDHFDYRGTASFVDALADKDTIVMGSARLMLDHYLEDPREVVELGTFEGGVPRDRIERQISIAEAEQRPLILVSREDRSLLSPDDQGWLYGRFALIRTFETKRFDHRRFRMAVYEYRPARDLVGFAAADATQVAVGVMPE